ncbi:MAG: amino acid ABC transporter permease [Oscillospiraceae bacterium]|nr:amino acid ABC transporter permease [Oscillospiraceae bacterium]MBQ8786490.1 amino acid ABC transporter permease [Oscillospiraceae bacterium]
MTWEEILQCTEVIARYLIPTLKIFGFTLLFSIPLGMVVALLKMCKFKPVSWLINVYILIMRGTPLMLQIITIYYAIPMMKVSDSAFLQNLFAGVDIKSESYQFNALIVAFALNYAAYFAEIFRGGIESIPKGQYEAAAALGMTKGQTFFRVVLPQVIKRIVPASSNEVITLVKDTSLASVIAYAEIFRKAKEQMVSYSNLTPLFIAGIFYFIMNAILTTVFAAVEKKLDYYK